MGKSLDSSLSGVISFQKQTGKPLAVILAGHNGSGKSTLWYNKIAEVMRIPLVNADRMMLSILPSADNEKPLPEWARKLRDEDTDWMQIAQNGVMAFVGQASIRKVPFAMETVFSHIKETKNGSVQSSKIDLIKSLQKQGYFVLLLFVGLQNAGLSLLRVSSRAADGGHDVHPDKILSRFPRTQKAVGAAVKISDAAILMDNSFGPRNAFQVVRIQRKGIVDFDVRRNKTKIPDPSVSEWLNIVCPSENK